MLPSTMRHPEIPVQQTARAGLLWVGLFLLRNAGFSTEPLPQTVPIETLTNLATWTLQGGKGALLQDPTLHRPVLMVEGDGSNTVVWTRPLSGLQPGRLYQFRFRARRDPQTTGGCVVAGPETVNRDFQVTPEWTTYQFNFRLPDHPQPGRLRLGLWEARGRVYFDQPELRPLQALHEPAYLGHGEWLDPQGYHFEPTYSWAGANYHRPLESCTAGFNTDRWVFSGNQEVVYRFEAPPGHRQTTARVAAQLNHHLHGHLQIEAATDIQPWTTLGQITRDRPAETFPIPESWFPARTVRIRLRTLDPETFLQVNRLTYQAALDPPSHAPQVGRTHWVLEEGSAWPTNLTWQSLRTGAAPGEVLATLSVHNPHASALQLKAAFGAEPLAHKVCTISVPPGQTLCWTLSTTVTEPGRHLLPLKILNAAGQTWAQATAEWILGWADDPRPGYPLTNTPTLNLWWCESAWKVGPHRPAPIGSPSPVRVSLARAEYEPVQLILRPRQSLVLRQIQLAPFRHPNGAVAPLLHRIHEVAYVQVRQPTDETCQPGEYPDPLPPLTLPLTLPPHRNQPLWLTFHAPEGTPAGLWKGELILGFDQGTVQVPLQVQVYHFRLPRPARLRSAFGLNPHLIARYHGLTNTADLARVYELYLQDFAEHRISPYSFYHGSEIQLRFEGPPAQRRAVLSFDAFDAAARRWLDSGAFNSFLLPLHGMGGGTFHSRHPGQLDGYPEGTPEHTRLFQDYLGQLECHLRTRGWLNLAYTYWFDEPEPKDYEFVIQGMQRIRAAAPGLRRMLTEQPEPELLGHVDIWCALTPEWTPEKVAARRAAGEEVWWYLCTVPRAPYLGLFIDHPGTSLRLWPWQSWQFGIQGILVWETTYWTSPTAFPDHLQNPWDDPMSYLSGYGAPPGVRIPWGNGDGRFLYPPRRNPNVPGPPVLQGPIPSFRWENLRDGVEDYDYFWLLQQEIERVERLPRARARQAAAAARPLLTVPETVSHDQTRFTTDPRPLLEHRHRVARAIEVLQQFR